MSLLGGSGECFTIVGQIIDSAMVQSMVVHGRVCRRAWLILTRPVVEHGRPRPEPGPIMVDHDVHHYRNPEPVGSAVDDSVSMVDHGFVLGRNRGRIHGATFMGPPMDPSVGPSIDEAMFDPSHNLKSSPNAI